MPPDFQAQQAMNSFLNSIEDVAAELSALGAELRDTATATSRLRDSASGAADAVSAGATSAAGQPAGGVDAGGSKGGSKKGKGGGGMLEGAIGAYAAGKAVAGAGAAGAAIGVGILATISPGVTNLVTTGDTQSALGAQNRGILQAVAAIPFFGGITGATQAEATLGRTEQRINNFTDDAARYGVDIPEDFLRAQIDFVQEQEGRVTQSRARVAGILGEKKNIADAAADSTESTSLVELLNHVQAISTALDLIYDSMQRTIVALVGGSP